METCEHGEAARNTPAQQPKAVRFDAEADLHALAMEATSAGVLGADVVDRIIEKYRAACASGVPLVAKLGETGYYVVWDGDNRSYPAGWAHVLCDLEGGASTASRKKRKTEHRAIVCKVRKRCRYSY